MHHDWFIVPALNDITQKTNLVVWGQSRIVQSGVHQFNEQIQELALALLHAEEPFLQGAQAGNILGHLEPQNLSVTMQELNHS